MALPIHRTPVPIVVLFVPLTVALNAPRVAQVDAALRVQASVATLVLADVARRVQERAAEVVIPHAQALAAPHVQEIALERLQDSVTLVPSHVCSIVVMDARTLVQVIAILPATTVVEDCANQPARMWVTALIVAVYALAHAVAPAVQRAPSIVRVHVLQRAKAPAVKQVWRR